MNPKFHWEKILALPQEAKLENMILLCDENSNLEIKVSLSKCSSSKATAKQRKNSSIQSWSCDDHRKIVKMFLNVQV